VEPGRGHGATTERQLLPEPSPLLAGLAFLEPNGRSPSNCSNGPPTLFSLAQEWGASQTQQAGAEGDEKAVRTDHAIKYVTIVAASAPRRCASRLSLLSSLLSAAVHEVPILFPRLG
jgi:hypothetical protein